ncbi:MAG: hypothetical protein SF053_14030 [Bacteroidia bacterium]|nr:hypothetical protein [Bacteroidia bacterium]
MHTWLTPWLSVGLLYVAFSACTTVPTEETTDVTTEIETDILIRQESEDPLLAYLDALQADRVWLHTLAGTNDESWLDLDIVGSKKIGHKSQEQLRHIALKLAGILYESLDYPLSYEAYRICVRDSLYAPQDWRVYTFSRELLRQSWPTYLMTQQDSLPYAEVQGLSLQADSLVLVTD